MKLKLIRNATMKINYNGKTILTDPMFSKKGSIRTFAGISPNPTVEMPLSIEEVLKDVDTVLVSHNHPDHLDEKAIETLPKEIKVFCQPVDEITIKENGFDNVTAVDNSVKFEGIEIIRVGGQHGKGEILSKMGQVSGFVLKAEKEPTVYWVGDSIWCSEIEKTIKTYKPDIIITHSGGATIPGFPPILMDVNDTIKVLTESSDAKVIAIHMEALDHCPVTRDKLLKEVTQTDISVDRLIIPKDGETILLA